MPTFRYTARNKRTAEKVTGLVEAPDRQSAVRQVELLGHMPISVDLHEAQHTSQPPADRVPAGTPYGRVPWYRRGRINTFFLISPLSAAFLVILAPLAGVTVSSPLLCFLAILCGTLLLCAGPSLAKGGVYYNKVNAAGEFIAWTTAKKIAVMLVGLLGMFMLVWLLASPSGRRAAVGQSILIPKPAPFQLQEATLVTEDLQTESLHYLGGLKFQHKLPAQEGLVFLILLAEVSPTAVTLSPKELLETPEFRALPHLVRLPPARRVIQSALDPDLMQILEQKRGAESPRWKTMREVLRAWPISVTYVWKPKDRVHSEAQFLEDLRVLALKFKIQSQGCIVGEYGTPTFDTPSGTMQMSVMATNRPMGIVAVYPGFLSATTHAGEAIPCIAVRYGPLFEWYAPVGIGNSAAIIPLQLEATYALEPDLDIARGKTRALSDGVFCEFVFAVPTNSIIKELHFRNMRRTVVTMDIAAGLRGEPGWATEKERDLSGNKPRTRTRR